MKKPSFLVYKSSLTKKITIRSFLLFFSMFTAFTVIAYMTTNYLLLEREKANIEHTMSIFSDRLSVMDEEVSTENFINIFKSNFDETKDDSWTSHKEEMANVLYLNLDVSVYDDHKKLIFTTNENVKNVITEKLTEVTNYFVKKEDTFILAKPVYSQKNDILIGYIELSHSLDFYKNVRNNTLLLLLVIEVVGMTLALAIISSSTKSFLKPIDNLHAIMTKIADNPSDLHLRSQIKSGDEIEELSVIFDNMLDRVENYTQLQANFISDVSHELRTPVAVIQGHVGMLQRWGKDDPKILDESLAATYNEAEKMSVMINDMLDMIRVQGSFDLHRNAICDLVGSINLVLSNFKVLKNDFTFIFDNQVSANEIWVNIYQNHFEQALTILIDNAVKYSPNIKEVTVKLELEDLQVKISITDKGEGMSQEDLKNIFNRFYRTDKSRNRTSTQSGLGIGLSILKQIVEAYRIDMSVTSELGKGTTFILKMPLVDKDNF